MELLKLLGILFVVVGFIRKWDTIATVIGAGLITGLVAVATGDMTFMEIFDTLGKAFVTQRTSTLFVLSIGVIGICERYGLKDKAKDAILNLRNATVGRFLSIWLIIREASAAFSLRLGGHVQFIRPLILPMAEGAVTASFGNVDEETTDKVKGYAAASENYGNFFGQNCFMGSSGTLLIVSTLVGQAEQIKDTAPEIAASLQSVTALDIASASWVIFGIAIVLGVGQFLLFDKKLSTKYSKNKTR